MIDPGPVRRHPCAAVARHLCPLSLSRLHTQRPFRRLHTPRSLSLQFSSTQPTPLSLVTLFRLFST